MIKIAQTELPEERIREKKGGEEGSGNEKWG